MPNKVKGMFPEATPPAIGNTAVANALAPPSIVLLAKNCDIFKFLPLKKVSAALANAKSFLASGISIFLPAIFRASSKAEPFTSNDLPI